MSTNLENSAVTTGQENFSFHPNLKERQNQRLFKLPYSCTHLIASKVMFKILQVRLQQYVNQELSDVQTRFRKGRGTRDQIANNHWMIEKAKEFLYENLFLFHWLYYRLCVDHNKLWKILKGLGISYQFTCLLRKLHVGQEATVRTRYRKTDWYIIWKFVHQGCILSPCLFNFCAEYVTWKVRLNESQAGIKINNLRYADDTTLIVESKEEIKSFSVRVKEETEKAGLKLSIQKTKIMAFGPITSWQNYGDEVETVADFIYLGSKITADTACCHKIKRCLLLGRKVMTNVAL